MVSMTVPGNADAALAPVKIEKISGRKARPPNFRGREDPFPSPVRPAAAFFVDGCRFPGLPFGLSLPRWRERSAYGRNRLPCFIMPGERMPSAARVTEPVAAFESGNGSRSVCRQGHSEARCCPPGHRKPLSGNVFGRRNGTNSTVSPAVESPKPFPRPARFADGSPREGIRVPSKGGSQNAPKKTGTTFSPRTSVHAGRTLAVPGMSYILIRGLRSVGAGMPCGSCCRCVTALRYG